MVVTHGSVADTAALSEILAPILAEHRESIERDRRLPQVVVRALKQAGVFRMSMPTCWGGPELDPITQFRIIEELSRMEPSVGWCAMIGSDGGFYSAHLADAAARELWFDLDAVTAGWLFPGGRATKVNGGYEVKGRWQFGSASCHADVFVAGCTVIDDGAVVISRATGQPEMRVVCVPAGKVAVCDNWHTTGLAGTGSNDYVIEKAFIPEEHGWTWMAPPVRSGALYRFPYMFLSNLAAVPLGAASAAREQLLLLAGTKVVMPEGIPFKNEARVQSAVARIEMLVSAARAWALEVLEQIWETVSRGREVESSLRARFRLSVMNAFEASKGAVDLAYETAGTAAVFRANPLDRLLRDVTTMKQHLMGSTKTLEPAGRVLLGLEPRAPMF